MELILLENILNLGSIGDKVKVKNGYGRNFLLKKGKALRFNKENVELVKKEKDKLNKKNLEIKNNFIKISKLINNKIFFFNRESKENGELYGTIKPKEIVNLIMISIYLNKFSKLCFEKLSCWIKLFVFNCDACAKTKFFPLK